jgi:hypothetical protein
MVFTSQWALAVVAWPFMHLYSPVVGIPTALYAVSVYRPTYASLLALLACAIPNGLAAFATMRTHQLVANGSQVLISTVVVLAMAAVGAWALGRLTRADRGRIRQLEREQEARQKATILATERRRAVEELRTILEDTTAIASQAGRAARVADTDLDQAIHALAHIETTARRAMNQLRRLFRMLEARDPAQQASVAETLATTTGTDRISQQSQGLNRTPAAVHRLSASGPFPHATQDPLPPD